MDFVDQGTFTTPSGTAAVNGQDGNNNTIFLGGANWRHGSNTLGLTTTSFYPGEIVDADMELNNNVAWANDGRQNAYDVESVVTHEAGHYIGIDHTNSGNAVMNPSIAPGAVKRDLLAPDQNDLCTVYPGASGGQGTPCTNVAMCAAGLVCEGPAGSTNRICTQDCNAAGAACPTGSSCQPSTAGFACLPQQAPSDLCRFCTGGADCSTGACLTNGMGFNWCSVTCNPAVANACPAGYSCQTSGTGTSYCVPAQACTNQCMTAQNCAPGYLCQGGACVPTGNPGDRCEVSGFCSGNCGVCVGDANNPNIAFCRQCCNNQGECSMCTSTTCSPVGGQSTMCVGLANTPEQVCLPNMGAALCQACSVNTPCQNGLSCYAGVCRSSCNPMNPGTCQACLGIQGGGVCACTNAEIATEGRPCNATTPLICRTGLTCAAGTCRTPCNPSLPVPCSAGFSCMMVGGQSVCVPSMGAGGGSAGGMSGGGSAGGRAGGVAGGGSAGGRAGGSAGGGLAGGGRAGGGSAGGGTAGGRAGGGAAGGNAGGNAGTSGGNAGGGDAGGNGPTGGGDGTSGGSSGTGGFGPQLCGPTTCAGCCTSSGLCVSIPTANQCGSSGNSCAVCGANQVCNAGQCRSQTTSGSSGCGCDSSSAVASLLWCVAALGTRRARHRRPR
jgi:hypothetical protein